MPKKQTELSPMECRILSELAIVGKDGISPTMLANWAGVHRSTLYVLLRRLAKVTPPRVRCERQILPGSDKHRVIYAITPTGRKVRERFAKHLGLKA